NPDQCPWPCRRVNSSAAAFRTSATAAASSGVAVAIETVAVTSASAPLPRGDLDLDPHCRIRQSCRDHRRGRTDLSEIFAQHRPALLKLVRLRHDVRDTDDLAQACPGLS